MVISVNYLLQIVCMYIHLTTQMYGKNQWTGNYTYFLYVSINIIMNIDVINLSQWISKKIEFISLTYREGHESLVVEAKEQLGSPPDVVVASVGGGGLLSGVLQGMQRVGWGHIPVVAMETEGADCLNVSLRQDTVSTIPAITRFVIFTRFVVFPVQFVWPLCTSCFWYNDMNKEKIIKSSVAKFHNYFHHFVSVLLNALVLSLLVHKFLICVRSTKLYPSSVQTNKRSMLVWNMQVSLFFFINDMWNQHTLLPILS